MKPVKIVGLEAILSFIYNEDHPPSAVLIPGASKDSPYCLHSLRSGSLAHNDDFFKLVAAESGVQFEKDEDKYVVHAFIDYESFRPAGNMCHGCYYLNREQPSEDFDGHTIGVNSEEVCTKLCEELA